MEHRRIRVGSIAVLFTVVVVCAAIFAVLTLVTAGSDLRTARSYEQRVEALYECENLGEQWLAGVITNEEGRTLQVETAFLESGKDYVLRAYTDDPDSDSPTKVRCSRWIVRGGQTLTFNLLPKGGAALHLIPATKADIKEYKKLKNTIL